MEWLVGLSTELKRKAFHYAVASSIGSLLLEPLPSSAVSICPDSGSGLVEGLAFHSPALQALIPAPAPIQVTSARLQKLTVSADLSISVDNLDVELRIAPSTTATHAAQTKPAGSGASDAAPPGSSAAGPILAMLQSTIDAALRQLRVTLRNSRIRLKSPAGSLVLVIPECSSALLQVRELATVPPPQAPSSAMGASMLHEQFLSMSQQPITCLRSKWRLLLGQGFSVQVLSQSVEGEGRLLNMTGSAEALLTHTAPTAERASSRVDVELNLPSINLHLTPGNVKALHRILHAAPAPPSLASPLAASVRHALDAASPMDMFATAQWSEGGFDSPVSTTPPSTGPSSPLSPSSAAASRASGGPEVYRIDLAASLQHDLQSVAQGLTGETPSPAQLSAVQASLAASFRTAAGSSLLHSLALAGDVLGQPGTEDTPPPQEAVAVSGFLSSLPDVHGELREASPDPEPAPIAPPHISQSWSAVRLQLARSGFWPEPGADEPGSSTPSAGAGAGRGVAAKEAVAETAAAASFLSSLRPVQESSEAPPPIAKPTPQQRRGSRVELEHSFSPDYLPSIEAGAFAAQERVQAGLQAMSAFEPAQQADTGVSEATAAESAASSPPAAPEKWQPGIFLAVSVLELELNAAPLCAKLKYISARAALAQTAQASLPLLTIGVGDVCVSARRAAGGAGGAHAADILSAPHVPGLPHAISLSLAPPGDAIGAQQWRLDVVVHRELNLVAQVPDVVCVVETAQALVAAWPLSEAPVEDILHPSLRWGVSLGKPVTATCLGQGVGTVKAAVHGLRVCGGTSRAVLVAVTLDEAHVVLSNQAGAKAASATLSLPSSVSQHGPSGSPVPNLFCLRAKLPDLAPGSPAVDLEYSWLIQPSEVQVTLNMASARGLADAAMPHIRALRAALAQKAARPTKSSAIRSVTAYRIASQRVSVRCVAPPLVAQEAGPGAALCLGVADALYDLTLSHVLVQSILQGEYLPESAPHTPFDPAAAPPRVSAGRAATVSPSWRASAGGFTLAHSGSLIAQGGGHRQSDTCEAAVRLQLGSTPAAGQGIPEGSHVVVALEEVLLLDVHDEQWLQPLLAALPGVLPSKSVAVPPDGVQSAAGPTSPLLVSLTARGCPLLFTGPAGRGALLTLDSATLEVLTPLAADDTQAGASYTLAVNEARLSHLAVPILEEQSLASMLHRHVQAEGSLAAWFASLAPTQCMTLSSLHCSIVYEAVRGFEGRYLTSIFLRGGHLLAAMTPASATALLACVKHLASGSKPAEGASTLAPARGGGVRLRWPQSAAVDPSPAGSIAAACIPGGLAQVLASRSSAEQKAVPMKPPTAPSDAPARGRPEEPTGAMTAALQLRADYFPAAIGGAASEDGAAHATFSVPCADGAEHPLHTLAGGDSAGVPVSCSAFACVLPAALRTHRYGHAPASTLAWAGVPRRQRLSLQPPTIVTMGPPRATAAVPSVASAATAASAPVQQLAASHAARMGTGPSTARTVCQVQCVAVACSVDVLLVPSDADLPGGLGKGVRVNEGHHGRRPSSDDLSTLAPPLPATAAGVEGEAAAAPVVRADSRVHASFEASRNGVVASISSLALNLAQFNVCEGDESLGTVTLCGVELPQGGHVLALTPSLAHLRDPTKAGPAHRVHALLQCAPASTSEPLRGQLPHPALQFAQVSPVAPRQVNLPLGQAVLGPAHDLATAKALQAATSTHTSISLAVPHVHVSLQPDAWGASVRLHKAAGPQAAGVPQPAGAAPSKPAARHTPEHLAVSLQPHCRLHIHLPSNTPATTDGPPSSGLSTLLPAFRWEREAPVAWAGQWSTHASSATSSASAPSALASAGHVAGAWLGRQVKKTAAASEAVSRHLTSAVGALGPHAQALGAWSAGLWKALQGMLQQPAE